MDLARRHAAPRRPWWWHLGLTAGLGLAAGGLLAGAATSLFARRVVTPPRRATQDVRVLHVDEQAGRITLTRTPDSLVGGRYGLWFDRDSGYAKIGPVLRTTEHTVVRELIAVEEGSPHPGARCRLSGWFYRDPSELGVPFSEVHVETELGPAPAWLVPSPQGSARWVIQVHGRGVDRRECLRGVPVFRDAGYTSLLISYRNDGIAPRSPDGLYSLGDVEWREVDAAVRYAIDRGATEIVLMGWSMGGATVLQAVSRSALARHITGVVLESPVVDWVTALDHQAGLLRIPRFITMSVYRVLSRPWGRLFTGQAAPIDLRRLDFVARAVELRVPMLILHSSGDRYVPNSASRALADARPDIVTFPAIADAGHTRVWNLDPIAFRSMIEGWLAASVKRRPSA